LAKYLSIMRLMAEAFNPVDVGLTGFCSNGCLALAPDQPVHAAICLRLWSRSAMSGPLGEA
jgi:hypothetical protein